MWLAAAISKRQRAPQAHLALHDGRPQMFRARLSRALFAEERIIPIVGVGKNDFPGLEINQADAGPLARSALTQQDRFPHARLAAVRRTGDLEIRLPPVG